MEFQLTKESASKLEELLKISASFKNDATLYVMRVYESKLYAILYTNGLLVKFSVPVESNDTGYFYVDLHMLNQIIGNVFLSSKSDKVSIQVDASRIVATAGRSKAVLPLLDEAPSDTEYEETFNAFDKKSELFESCDAVKIVPKIISFAGVMSKYISLYASLEDISGIAVEKNELKYSDQRLTIFKMPLDTYISDKNHVIPQMMFGVLAAINKIVSDFTIEYSGDEHFIRCDVPEIEFQFIVTMPLAVCEFPEDEDYRYLAPDPESSIHFEVNKLLLFEKLSAFNGVFSSSSWKWKSIDFILHSEDASTVILRHMSDTGEIEVDLPLLDCKRPESEDDAKFKISASMLEDYLKNFSDADTVSFDFTNLPSDGEVAHSIGVEVSSGSCKFLLGKIEDDEVLGI